MTPASTDISAPQAIDPIEAAICSMPPDPEVHFFGISQVGQLYAYGVTHDKPQRVIPDNLGICFDGILACSITTRSERDYLDLRLQAPIPYCVYVLSLPCQGSRNASGHLSTQWSVRSLMGALSQVCAELDLRATSGKLRARRGTGGAANLKANFIDLFLDTGIGPDGDYERIFAQAIDGDRASLEAAVRQVSQSLTTEH